MRGVETVRDDQGFRFRVDLDDFIGAHLALDGSFEGNTIRQFSQRIENRGCQFFLDIGANIGIYSVRIGSLKTIRKVYAFEPDPTNFEFLLENIGLNGIQNKVQPMCWALSSVKGTAQLFAAERGLEVDWKKLNRGANSLQQNPTRHSKSFSVETIPLDDALKLEDENIAVKIDVEGHEAEVLLGMKEFLTRNHGILLIEIFPDNRDRVINLLNGLGYFENPDWDQTEGYNYLFEKTFTAKD